MGTIIKTTGFINNPRMILNGLTFNVDNEGAVSPILFKIYILSRLPKETDPQTERVILKAYNGTLNVSSGSEMARKIKEETIDNIVVRTYSVQINGVTYTDKDGVNHNGRSLFGTAERVDVINAEDFDIICTDTSSADYNSPVTFPAEQFEYYDFSNTTIFNLTHTDGVFKTEWLKNAHNASILAVLGKATCVGTIMDLVDAYDGKLKLFNFFKNYGVTGTMSIFLDALKAKGAKSTTIDCHITSTGIINDVSTKTTFDAIFDANGDWTVTDPIPLEPEPED